MGDLLVRYSATLDGHVVDVGGLLVTTPERTLIDLWGSRPPWERSKILREALRRKLTTPVDLLTALNDHRGHRGVALLRAELLGRMHLPFHRCKSDGEAFALVVLHDAGVEIPRVNEVFAGEEADFCWAEPKDIIEIDGPQWHRFKEDDARKTRAWAEAGFRTQRIATTLLFADPPSLLRLAPPPGPGPGPRPPPRASPTSNYRVGHPRNGRSAAQAPPCAADRPFLASAAAEMDGRPPPGSGPGKAIRGPPGDRAHETRRLRDTRHAGPRPSGLASRSCDAPPSRSSSPACWPAARSP
jgi:hypothetical protein